MLGGVKNPRGASDNDSDRGSSARLDPPDRAKAGFRPICQLKAQSDDSRAVRERRLRFFIALNGAKEEQRADDT